jgi:phosphoenolpyruvate phosphomutase
MKKTTVLKQMIQSKDLAYLMEAHNGLSAKIAEEAGFQGIWGSGLSISAAMGVRDNNEASWTQVLETVEFMSDATTVPILLDGDTGYGNFNNMRRLVRKLEQRGVAGVCIEDKIFPKTNSFLRGEKQPLADIEEFSGKIKAGLDARTDDDFCIVARVEAFIAGWGLEEALRRAEAYRNAGATAILMHSKKSTPDDIFSFMKEWGDRCPVVIVPTKYYSTPTEEFKKRGISTAIWANHLMRSSVKAMQETAKQIFIDENLMNVEDNIVPVKEVFRLQNDQELAEAEKLYFHKNGEKKAIILAASRGKELGELTANKPKALLNVNGQPILKQTIDKLRNFGVEEINVVRGYKKESFPELGCNYIDNDDYSKTGELASLFKAKDHIDGNLTIGYGDIIFKSYILNMMEESPRDITIVVDSKMSNRDSQYVGDFVFCNRENTKIFGEESALVLKTKLQQRDESEETPHGEWIGLVRTSAKGSEILKTALMDLSQKNGFGEMKMGDMINYLIEKDIEIGVSYIEGNWMDVDNFKDYEKIQVF